MGYRITCELVDFAHCQSSRGLRIVSGVLHRLKKDMQDGLGTLLVEPVDFMILRKLDTNCGHRPLQAGEEMSPKPKIGGNESSARHGTFGGRDGRLSRRLGSLVATIIH